MDKIFGLLSGLGMPFMMVTQDGRKQWNGMRIIESLIIVAITAFLTSQLTVARMDEKIKHMDENANQRLILINKMCDRLEDLQKRVTVIEVHQNERIIRERQGR